MIDENASNRDFMRDDKLKEISRLDGELYLRLYDMANGSISQTVLDKVHDKLQQHRVLDDVPSVLKLNSKGAIPSGTVEIFKHIYNSIEVSPNEEEGKIEILGQKVWCDPKVIKTLKAVIKTGCCRNEDLSTACREVFMQVLRIGKSVEVITVPRMLESLSGKRYYEKKIIEAINVVHSPVQETLEISEEELENGD